jgi:hypothetical protein
VNLQTKFEAHLKVKSPVFAKGFIYFCGERGIRTLGTPKGSTVFETAPIDHSGISPIVREFRVKRLQR